MRFERENYTEFYAALTAPWERIPGAGRILTAMNRVLTLLMYVLYPLLLLALLMRHDGRLLRAVLVPGISFVLLSFVRHRINRPRPYETWAISQLIRREKRGDSMPSRHVFSSMVISMVFLWFSPAAGIFGIGVTLVCALVRVIGGVHYPSDVLVGALCGVAAGLFLWI